MTISTTDLKLYKSQRNRDTNDGGGAMSPNEVVDGEINNVFDDISSEDRVTGRVSIRKVFPGVFSNNTDKFFGAGLMIINPAQDSAVDVLMTRNTAYDDEREDVVARIQSYLIPGATITWRLFNDHLQGSGTLTLFGFFDAATPELGETLFLEDSLDDTVREAVKIQSVVSRQSQTFEDASGTFQRDILVLQISRPLQNDWEGTAVQRATTLAPPTRLRTATVSAGAKYFGVKQVDEDITAGDLTVKVPSPFGQVVPTTNAESPLTDQRATLSGVSYAKVGADDSITVSASQAFDAGQSKSWYLGGTVFPGSVAVSGTVSGTDQGDGTITFAGSSTTGAIDYETGEVTITRLVSGSLSLSITATPGAAIQDSNLTVQIPVNDQNRALNYVRSLRPLPAPGTVSVDYRVLNNWYRLSDDGTGTLSGAAPGQGGGTVNYATGTVTATLTELPDLGTTIIFSWGNPVIASDQSGNVESFPPQIAFTISNGPIEPGSLEITYDSDGSTITHTSDADGNIIDAALDNIGRYVPGTGEVAFIPKASEWPDFNAAVNYTFEQSTNQLDQLQPTPSGANDLVSFNIPNAPREPGSVVLTWPVEQVVNDRTRILEMTCMDDGQGGFIYPDGSAVPSGTINYTTGAVSLPLAYEVSI